MHEVANTCEEVDDMDMVCMYTPCLATSRYLALARMNHIASRITFRHISMPFGPRADQRIQKDITKETQKERKQHI